MKFFYGIPGVSLIEVTEIIRSLAKDNRLTISCNYNSLFGDPCLNRRKRLLIQRGEKRYSFVENTPLLINLEEEKVEQNTVCSYFLSVFAIFKNESRILKEWIEHYLREGVEHFFLIDNGSTDNYQPILEEFKDKITLYQDGTPYGQNSHYSNYLFKHKWESEWIILVDLDEFVYSRKGFPTIKSYLETLDQKINRVVFFWKNFGSNGHIEQPSSVIQGFTRRYFLKPILNIPGCNTAAKCIFRGSKVHYLDFHLSPVNGKSIFSNGKEVNVDQHSQLHRDIQERYYSELETHSLHINHYKIQSYNWFKEVKVTRGDASTSLNVRNDEYFRKNDFNQEEDLELSNKIY